MKTLISITLAALLCSCSKPGGSGEEAAVPVDATAKKSASKPSRPAPPAPPARPATVTLPEGAALRL
ncbi:MAG: hypothetical protein ACRD96_22915, partial [Bryobacteraceae bacterium]